MRQIYIVNATQVVVSEAHPEGVYSVLPDYPKRFDSLGTSEETALRLAKSEYHARLSAFEAANNRAAWCVTLERADGRQIMCESFGGFPDEPETAMIDTVV